MMISEMRQILRGFFAQIHPFDLQFEGVFLFPGKFPKMILFMDKATYHKKEARVKKKQEDENALYERRDKEEEKETKNSWEQMGGKV